jgi:hypothetical protein
VSGSAFAVVPVVTGVRVGTFDLALSMSEDSLNMALGSLFERPSLRASVFSGRLRGSGLPLSVDWSIDRAPQVSLDPPTSAQWADAVKADLTVPEPAADALVVTIPVLSLLRERGDGSVDHSTTSVAAICVLTVTGSTIAIKPLAAVVDLSAALPVDRALLRAVIIPKALQIAAQLFTGLAIPVISVLNVGFTAPVLTIGRGRITGVANLVPKDLPAALDPAVHDNLTGPLALLLSREAMQQTATAGLASFAGATRSTTGSADFTVGTAGYSASVTVHGGSITVGPDPRRLSASLNLTTEAGAGVDVLDRIESAVVEAATTVGGALAGAATTAVSAVGDAATTAADAVADAASTVADAVVHAFDSY